MSVSNQEQDGESANLRRRIAALEAELARVKSPDTVVDGPLPAREALLAEAEKIMHMGSWILNLETGDVKWSEELFRILGYDPAKDKATTDNFFAAVHPADRPPMLANLATLKENGILIPFAARIVWKDGTVRETLGDGKVVRDARGDISRVVGSVLDITERKLLESQLRQSHKMEAVGRLAAGVAHDFNNLLSVISGNADLLLENRPDEKLRRIRDAAEVGAALTRQLLGFSRQSVIRPVPLDLNEVARDTVRIIERVIGENIAIRLDLLGDHCAILADRAQIQQILLNLSINARDAMPGGGEIRVSTSPAADPSSSGPAAAPGAWVRLTVQDTGSGMDEATRLRAFEPFFTTKEPGKGTGLGLCAVHDAVTQASGQISIDSVLGKGTAVTILFPCQACIPVPASRLAQDVRGGTESILVVEDHPALRELIRAFLAGVGYDVQTVGRPGEAEALWARDGARIDLLITDLVMPEKSGRVLAADLHLRKPGLKTLFISGYDQGMGPGKKVEGPYLQKPFTRAELLQMVRSIFDNHLAAQDNGHNRDPGKGAPTRIAHVTPPSNGSSPSTAPSPAQPSTASRPNSAKPKN